MLNFALKDQKEKEKLLKSESDYFQIPRRDTEKIIFGWIPEPYKLIHIPEDVTQWKIRCRMDNQAEIFLKRGSRFERRCIDFLGTDHEGINLIAPSFYTLGHNKRNEP